MTIEEQRAVWATEIFGWIKLREGEATGNNWRDGYGANKRWLDDFEALDGPWFGPCVKRLLDADWELSSGYINNEPVYGWQDEEGEIEIEGLHLGEVTLNAELARVRQQKEPKRDTRPA